MSTILVTGASGYIAKHIVLRLLQAGHHVRGSIRSPARGETLRATMAALVPEAMERLTLVPLDLTRDDGWAEAAAGADAILHTASPFPLSQPKDPQEVIRPAVDGARRAIRAAATAGVPRVVLTSSIAAVVEGPQPQGRRYDERDWSDPEAPTISPYSASKTLAERAAWDMVATEAPGVALTTINPGFVLGAPLDGDTGTSLAVVERLLAGRDPMLPNFGFACVDVGDIAEMHLRALDTPASIGQRIVGASDFLWYPEMAEILAAAFPDRRIPTRRAPSLLIWALGHVDPAVAAIRSSLNLRRELDASRARDLLGITFRDPRESLVDTARWLAAQGRA
ncbi:NAD-dependent epimerase/dehydratase family protein [Roseicyclus persicicus]|uniref:NAD-dependent epimerase/dehydratase family protein n=1 Tax=Roseicyclus persicicus TaxID=2650661 RepID=A0A7X6GWJ1_9RHOB|nr:NAD-dependent epimerase/dehydratase family protein [Roseibacterium persicicum]NKX42994.1 NAD-dependent epimerase/dehydratase family protein [Roseibacterium persicicum]